MAEFLEDPSVLTKDKLKNELVANNVPLPSGEHKKEVYVQLYLKNLTAQNSKKNPPADTFSSDEELPAPVVSNKSRSGRVSVCLRARVCVCGWIDGAVLSWIWALFFTESHQKDRQAPGGGRGGGGRCDGSRRWRFETTAGKIWRGHRAHCW